VKSAHLTILSRTEKLKSVRDFVAAEATAFGFDEETVNKISIAVDEACTNIIKHSYEFAKDKSIDITISTKKEEFEIIIAHDGKTFNPDAVTQPDMKEYLTHYRRGGLGMHLMRSLMDRVEYSVKNGKRSEVRLLKYLPVKVRRP
jgi:serine/threonine-protein kinase RsbW